MEKGDRGKVVRLTRKEKERKILEMWRSGHTYKEICSALHVSTKTVSKVIRKAEEAEEEREPQARKEDIERLLKDVSKLKELYERLFKRLEIISQSFDGRLDVVEVRTYDLNKWRSKVDDVLKEVHRLDKLEGRLKELEAFSYRLAKDLPLLILEVRFMADLLKDYFYYTVAFVKDLKKLERFLEKWREERDRKAKEEAKQKMLLARCIYG